MNHWPSIARFPLRRVCLIGALVVNLATAVKVTKASVVFDWPAAPGWTAGAPNAGQTKTQSFTDGVAPNDVTVSINNNGAAAQGMQWDGSAGGYPQISANSTNGGTSLNGLELQVNKSQVSGAYLKTTISFAAPVANLTLQIWDVDALPGQFIDKLYNIQALAVGGATVGANLVTSAVAGFNTITGTGLSTVVLGTANADNATNQGTINITFNGPITQFSFEWANNDPALGKQAIGIGELTYNIVPESNSAVLAAICCLTAILFEWLRRPGRLIGSSASSEKKS